MARVTGLTLERKAEDNAVEIHVHGDMLPNHIFNEIITIIRDNHEDKSINFTVENPTMMLLIREAVPREYYNGLELKPVSGF